MNKRDFILAACNVANRRSLAAALRLVHGYATGRQKWVHECVLTTGERNDLMHQMHQVSLLLEEDTDRFLLLRLVPRAHPHSRPHQRSGRPRLPLHRLKRPRRVD